jgi:LuxR family maltose regulon positive regulatory protein
VRYLSQQAVEGGITRTVVAAAKLTIPRWRRPLVARPTLSAQLDGEYRFALVSAPAGYGKTATLATWAAAQSHDVAWLSCDALDAEPTRFMSCLLASISTRWPGVADDAFVLLDRDGANTYDAAVSVANELAGVDGRGVIVIDDLHLAAPAPTMLGAFIDALPERFRFVAGTRTDPPLSLGRLRLRGELLELRGDELAFDAAELADFFELQDVTFDDDELGRLHELTEGWPAGAQLAAIAVQRGAQRHDFLDAFASTDRAVSDFLVSEVLASLPSDLVDFLVETSVFEMFDAELCAAVTGAEDAAMVLDRLVRANMFIIPLDEPGRWFRYHHLFGAFLRARLRSLGRARMRNAHLRASAALEDKGSVAGALRHAMTVGDADRAGQILRAGVRRSYEMSDGDGDAVPAVRLWLHERGADCIESDPVLVLELLIGLMTLNRPDDAPAWLQRITAAHPDADGPLTALIEGAWSEHLENRGQPLEALRHLAVAMDVVGGRPPNAGLLPLLPIALARAHIQAGQLEPAAAVLADARAHSVGNAVAEARNRGVAAFVAAADGELRQAVELVRLASVAADELALGDRELGRIYAGLAMVELHAERHEHENAREVLTAVRAAADANRRVLVQSLVTLQHAKLARAVGDEAGATALLEQANLFFDSPDPAVRGVLADEAVAQALRFDPARAASLIAELDPDRVTTGVFRARLALLDGDDPLAADLLAELPPARSLRDRVERAVLLALSVLERDVERANEHVAEALAAGQPDWLVRTVIEHGPKVHKLLVSYTPRSVQERYIDRLLSATSHDVGAIRVTAPHELVDPLSARELTVLRYLCSRLTYVEIASALYVSINTLKSHVRTVYRKLDVASRADAVVAGRGLGLI